jgi:hypothetical protein
VIFSKSLKIEKSASIESGYNFEDGRSRGDPANSGGSVYIMAQNIEIEGKISANGQSSESNRNGPGAGGRILLHNYCWADGDNHVYDFTTSALEALPGERKLGSEYRKYSSLLQAENGCKV